MRNSLAGMLLVCAAALGPAGAGGTIFTVDVTADELDGACVVGDCSLREALADAVDDDEIVFALPGTPPWSINLQTALGPLVVDHTVTITGPGMTELAISGDQAPPNGTGDVRVMRIDPGASALITDLTIRDGRATTLADRNGGCVRNVGDVLFSSVRFQNCRAWSPSSNGFTNSRGGEGGAVYSEVGTATAFDLCEFVSNLAGTGDIGPDGTTAGPGGRGGAIATLADLVVRRSTFTSNSAGLGGNPNGDGGEGGAIAVLGGLASLVEDSTFATNHSGDGRNNLGSGADGAGGALYLLADTALNNVTLSGNTIGVAGAGTAATGGGLAVAGGTTRLRNVTVTLNTANGAGGGIARSGGTLIVRNSIFGGNTSSGTTSEDCTTNVPASLVSEGYNILTVGTGCAASFNGTGDQIGAAPGLDPLAANGGPTQTHALQSGSAAIDTGDPAGCEAWDPVLGIDVLMTADQRGEPRPLDGDGDTVPICDAGSYEAPVPVPEQHDLTVALAGTGTGLVTSVPAGISCPADCSETYLATEIVALTPAAAAGSVFTGWSGDCTGTGACNVAMTADRTVTATFELLRNLFVEVIGSGTVTSNPAGISCAPDCLEDYPHGTSVTLTPTPAAGWIFSHWNGACTGSGACVVTMTNNLVVAATFVQLRTLTVAVVGSGTVTSNPAGISCNPDCTEDYPNGTSVSLTPTPAAGWIFSAWSGACTGSGACTVDMTANRSVTATFVQLRNLFVEVIGSGTVTSNPAGISCAPDCTEDYPHGTSVTLTPTPAAGWIFSHWTGSCSGGGACVVSMTADRAVVATFVQLRTLTVSVVGSGSVTSNPAGISCNPDCTEDYPHGTSVSLTPTPAAGWIFSAWSGACAGGGACTVSMTANQSVTATFVPVGQVFTLTVTTTAGGSVTSNPAGISCPGDCGEDYPENTVVELTAAPAPDYHLVAWTGDCSGNGACSVTMDQARTVGATFDTMPFVDGFETGDTSRWSSRTP